MINANSRKHIKENLTSTKKKIIHQRFFVCSFKEKFRVKVLSNEHSYHDDNEHSALTTQENHNEFNIMNRNFTDQSLFERKKKTKTNK